MVMTIVEGRLADGKDAELKQAYASETGDPGHMPAGLVESALVQSLNDPSVWRILTVWESREALSEMRRTTAVPSAIMMFRSVGSEPTVGLFDVAATVHR